MNGTLRHLTRISKAKKERKRQAIDSADLARQHIESPRRREVATIAETPAIEITKLSRWQRMKDRVSVLWKRGKSA